MRVKDIIEILSTFNSDDVIGVVHEYNTTIGTYYKLDINIPLIGIDLSKSIESAYVIQHIGLIQEESF